MPNGSNSFNPNNSGNNTGPNPNAEAWQNIDAANGTPNLENMNLDQLLELDIDNLSYEELKVMHRRLTEEIQVIDTNIARLRQNLGLPPIELNSVDPNESQPIPTSPDQPIPTGPDQPIGDPTQPDQPIADPTGPDQPIVNPIPPVHSPQQPAPSPDQPTGNPDNQPSPDNNPTDNQDDQPGPTNNPNNQPNPTDNPNRVSPTDVKEMDKKGRKKPTFRQYAKKVFYQGAAIALTAFTLFTAGSKLFNKRNNKETNIPKKTEWQSGMGSGIGQSAETIIEANNEDDAVADGEFAGELPNGVTYDYSHYADRDEKESYNAFDYDMSEYFNNVDGTKESFMDVASSTPEALAAYSYSIFNTEEKANLGIDGMTANQIDDYISNDANGGAMQQRLLAALQNVLDEDGTELHFYYENGKEKTYYIYFVDDNENGKMDPGEMHLAYDIKDRKNALQVTILRDGKAALDLNISCGYQPNFEQAPEGVPYVPSGERTEETRRSYVKVSYDGKAKIKEGDQSSFVEEKDIIKTTKDDSTGNESTGNEKTGDEGTETDTEETDKAKDPENLKRIDEDVDKKDAEDHGSEDLNKEPTPKEEVDSQEPTEKPDSDSYDGTEAKTEKNEESDDAEDVHEDVSSDNDYEEDRGDAHEEEYSPNEDDDSGQDEADEHESSDEESAPDTADEAEDELEDLDIE